MAVIIEVTDAKIQAQHRYILEHDNISIGRAYNNDVVIDDPYCDPLHAQLSLVEGQLWMQDLASLNGIIDQQGKRINEGQAIQSGDNIQIGKTQLRILDSEHPLPATLPLETGKRSFLSLAHPSTALMLCALSILLHLDNIYLNAFHEENWSHYLLEGSSYLLLLLIPTAIIGFIGKVAQKQWRLAANFSLVCITTLAIGLLQQPFDLIQFNYYIGEDAWLFETLSLTVALAAVLGVLLFNLPIKRLRNKWLIITSLSAVALTIQVIHQQETQEKNRFFAIPTSKAFMGTTLPWVNQETETSFMQRSTSVYEIDLEAFKKSD